MADQVVGYLLDTDADGVGFIEFSPTQARHLASLLIKHAGDIDQSSIEAPAPKALEAIKTLFSKEAHFLCSPGDENVWRITIIDEGRPFADDSNGQPQEVVNSEHMGRVLAARKLANDEG